MVEQRFCKPLVVRSNRIGGLSSITPMSLISQQDRLMAIEALEYYVQKLKDDNCNQAAISSFQTLLNWIELEYFKHED